MAPLVMLMGAARADAGAAHRVRSESTLLRAVIANTLDHSATFRSLLERIEQSDVIVYVTCHRFDDSTLSGRTGLATALSGVRYLRVQVVCEQPEQLLVAIVAHELQHAVEIASTTSVVDEQTFGRLFSTIGFRTCLTPGREQFETKAAIEVGDRVRKEYRLRSTAKHAKRANRKDVRTIVSDRNPAVRTAASH